MKNLKTGITTMMFLAITLIGCSPNGDGNSTDAENEKGKDAINFN